MIQGYKLGEDDFRGRALRQSSARAQGQQRSSHADQARDHPRHRPPISGSRRRFHRDQHLQFQLHQPGRLRPGPSGGRVERGRRAAGARALRRSMPPPTGRAWSPACWARPTAPPPSRPTSTIRPSATSPSTSCARPIAKRTRGLISGGADVIMIETVFDTLNARPRSSPSRKCSTRLGVRLPVWISGTITDLSGRTLTGQTPEAFWHSVRHAKPFAIGLNCALGAKELRPYIADLARRRRHAGQRASQCRPAQRIRRL